MWKQTEQTYWQATPFRAVAEPGIQLKVTVVKAPHLPFFWALCPPFRSQVLPNGMWTILEMDAFMPVIQDES